MQLLLISLGPIQDFIASARRCQDLWFGSWLLSDLAREVALSLQKSLGGESLIFPAKLSIDPLSEGKPGVANKLLVVVPEDHSALAAAEAGRAAMKKRLTKLSSVIYRRIPSRFFHRDIAVKQLDDLMEYLWVSVPYSGEYAPARDAAEALLAARKNTRTWRGVSWSLPGVPKSSLDGMRESVYNEALYKTSITDQERWRYFVKKKERLCGVGVLKRAGVEDDPTLQAELFQGRRSPPFHSTSHIATAPLLVRHALRGCGGALEGYLTALDAQNIALLKQRIRPGSAATITLTDPLDPSRTCEVSRTWIDPRSGEGYDGRFLFEDRLPDLVQEAGADDSDALRISDALRGDLGRFLQDGLNLYSPPTPYYAMLLADGDRMGKALQALSSPPDGLEVHREFGRLLEKFTSRCQTIVTEHAGSLIYAGGDDVLALLPLHTALQCTAALKDAFLECLAPAFSGSPIPQPTLSAGLAVCHHLQPMVEVRALAKQAEKLAKIERNSLAVIVNKRSGGELSVTATWEDGLEERLWEWARLFRDEDLPDKAAFELEQATLPLLEFADDDPGEVIFSLAKRALSRRQAKRGEAPLSEAVASRLRERFKDAPNKREAIHQLSTELQMARLFLSAWTDAWAEPTSPEQG